MPSSREHAVVLGASMGGLLAARALSDHFEQVTVLERDQIPPIGENRRGVPQGQHLHVLLARGAGLLEQLFPGFREEVTADGGLSGVLSQYRLIFAGNRMRHFPSDLRTLQATRPRLEGHVRRRVLALPNVKLIAECDVAGPVASEDRQRVTGVRVGSSDGAPSGVVEADLLVDATGRGSRSPRWLEELGYASPSEERVGVDIRYMSRLYYRKPSDLDGALGVFISPRLPATRGAGAFAVEGNRWMVTLATYFGERLPQDADGFREFAASLPAPDLADLLATADPCSEAISANYPASQRRRYERLKRFPEGYLVFGDALCNFNPIYGQGMSVAAIEAMALTECLRETTNDLAPRFFKRAAQAVEIPWTIAVGSDLRYDRVEGRRPIASRAMNWYLDRLLMVTEDDEAVAEAFLTVNNLEGSPGVLMRPGIVARVARGRLRSKRRRSQSA